VLGTSLYELNPENTIASGRCFRASITKAEDENSIITTVEALGYNICNKKNFRTVERAIEVHY
ncbi:MAG: hypothetical protein WCG45_06000, partial [bacterium]